MTTFKTVVRKKRADGFYPVYIRVVHRSRMGYIKTDKVVTDKQIMKSGDIKDAYVNDYCSHEILRYTDMINRKDVSRYSVMELIEYLTRVNDEVCFSDYATKFIDSLSARTAKNYRLAVNHLERFLGTNQIMFSYLSSIVLKRWIESLAQTTSRAKEMYPVCVRQIFKKAMMELNDEERGVIPIKFNPWLKISIPKSDSGVKRAISAEACREFFGRPLPATKMISSLPELGRDVALMSLCIGGINTIDLYEMKKTDYHDGKVCYKRAKTRNSRKDEAYIEMRIEPYIQSVFDKYLSTNPDEEYLFNFHDRYGNSDSFNANVNIGIRKICKDMGMKKEDYYRFYTFRHTWGTIAQNDCDANLYDVAFGMNHSQGLNVTRGYVKIDFTPAWELNAKVIDFIFFSDEKSKQGKAKDVDAPQNKMFRISKKMMIYGRAYFKGKVISELTNLGFSTVDDVIKELASLLPTDIPNGSNVQFRLTNCDSQMEVVYERSKGKGF